jgi:hypothetical protein
VLKQSSSGSLFKVMPGLELWAALDRALFPVVGCKRDYCGTRLVFNTLK